MRTDSIALASPLIKGLLACSIPFLLVVYARPASLNCKFADEQGKALRNVEVRLTPVGTENHRFEKADKTGQVVFRNLKAGSFELRAQLKDHVAVSREVNVTDDLTLALTLMTHKGFDGLEQDAEQALNGRDFPKAIGIYEKLLTAYPQDPTLHFNLARVHAALLQEDKALAEVAKAAQLDPQFSDKKLEIKRYIMLEQGQEALQKRDFSKAADVLGNLVKEDPENAQAYEGLALAYGHQEKYQQALTAINRALELDPKNDTYMKVKKILETNAGAK